MFLLSMVLGFERQGVQVQFQYASIRELNADLDRCVRSSQSNSCISEVLAIFPWQLEPTPGSIALVSGYVGQLEDSQGIRRIVGLGAWSLRKNGCFEDGWCGFCGGSPWLDREKATDVLSEEMKRLLNPDSLLASRIHNSFGIYTHERLCKREPNDPRQSHLCEHISMFYGYLLSKYGMNLMRSFLTNVTVSLKILLETKPI